MFLRQSGWEIRMLSTEFTKSFPCGCKDCTSTPRPFWSSYRRVRCHQASGGRCVSVQIYSVLFYSINTYTHKYIHVCTLFQSMLDWQKRRWNLGRNAEWAWWRGRGRRRRKEGLLVKRLTWVKGALNFIPSTRNVFVFYV